tara:strand:- start:1041 stop:1277 length:237 start_codon:yes stop_codon:yes gene_type:complete
MGNKSYNGYSSCPLIKGYGKIVLAKFDYDKNFISNTMLKQLFIKDSSKEHRCLWMLKKAGFHICIGSKCLRVSMFNLK